MVLPDVACSTKHHVFLNLSAIYDCSQVSPHREKNPTTTAYIVTPKIANRVYQPEPLINNDHTPTPDAEIRTTSPPARTHPQNTQLDIQPSSKPTSYPTQNSGTPHQYASGRPNRPPNITKGPATDSRARPSTSLPHGIQSTKGVAPPLAYNPADIQEITPTCTQIPTRPNQYVAD